MTDTGTYSHIPHPLSFILLVALPLPVGRVPISCHLQANFGAFDHIHVLSALYRCSLFLVCCFLLVCSEQRFPWAIILKCGGHDFCILWTAVSL
jgi:hypothetical protein